VEALTDDLEGKAAEYLRRIDEMGGMVEAISRQFPQHEIEDAAYAAQKEVEEKKQVVVGVNEFTVEGEPPFDTLRIDPQLEEQQVARVRAFRRSRDNSAATRALSDLKAAAEGTENLVPRIVAAVKARATLGEIANSMREVFGEHGHA
jgi:methylmalonyl-CoA mutase N-terminal domain/subunit